MTKNQLRICVGVGLTLGLMVLFALGIWQLIIIYKEIL